MSYTHQNLIPLVAMGSRRKRKGWEKTHFEIFGQTDCDLSTSSSISSNLNILVSTHPIGKLKIVMEILGLGEDMVKNPF